MRSGDGLVAWVDQHHLMNANSHVASLRGSFVGLICFLIRRRREEFENRIADAENGNQHRETKQKTPHHDGIVQVGPRHQGQTPGCDRLLLHNRVT